MVGGDRTNHLIDGVNWQIAVVQSVIGRERCRSSECWCSRRRLADDDVAGCSAEAPRRISYADFQARFDMARKLHEGPLMKINNAVSWRNKRYAT